jgi:hypothetical protein
MPDGPPNPSVSGKRAITLIDKSWYNHGVQLSAKLSIKQHPLLFKTPVIPAGVFYIWKYGN